ncbi:MAG: phosphotransferase [Capsulimonadaceae bacterium]
MGSVDTPVREMPDAACVGDDRLRAVARAFEIEPPIEVRDFPDKGNINRHTYLIIAGRARREYLLQKINGDVFRNPRRVLSAMVAAIDAQRTNAVRAPAGWEPVTLVPSRSGEPFVTVADREGTGYWRLMVRIANARTYKSLEELADPSARLAIAREAARGLAAFGDLVGSVNCDDLRCPLPGYRDTRNYLNQLHSVVSGHRAIVDAAEHLPADEDLLHSTGHHFLVQCSRSVWMDRMRDPAVAEAIATVRGHREFALSLVRALESGEIRRVAVHGDTKLENFLFHPVTGGVRALVDLDTIMPHTWLSDWGDMVRSLVNVAGEQETDLDRVQVDLDVYRALSDGFLDAARTVTRREVALMPDAPAVLALELGARFLADYLRGDTYFQLGPNDPVDLNRTRALVQLTLFHRLRAATGHTRL